MCVSLSLSLVPSPSLLPSFPLSLTPPPPSSLPLFLSLWLLKLSFHIQVIVYDSFGGKFRMWSNQIHASDHFQAFSHSNLNFESGYALHQVHDWNLSRCAVHGQVAPRLDCVSAALRYLEHANLFWHFNDIFIKDQWSLEWLSQTWIKSKSLWSAAMTKASRETFLIVKPQDG